jgi:hypothetical protein
MDLRNRCPEFVGILGFVLRPSTVLVVRVRRVNIVENNPMRVADSVGELEKWFNEMALAMLDARWNGPVPKEANWYGSWVRTYFVSLPCHG